jgi:chromatin segregation and condensation protein Rec8/ScpA/Scc1 (kleisin family)
MSNIDELIKSYKGLDPNNKYAFPTNQRDDGEGPSEEELKKMRKNSIDFLMEKNQPKQPTTIPTEEPVVKKSWFRLPFGGKRKSKKSKKSRKSKRRRSIKKLK